MLISTKGRYALRVMLQLAEQKQGDYTCLDVVANAQGISEKYLESIVGILSKAKLVEGLRGRGGGYRLNRAPGDYSVGEILRVAEGSLVAVNCLGCKPNQCDRAADCLALPVWEKLDNLINDYLDSVTLTDLLDQSRQHKPDGPD